MIDSAKIFDVGSYPKLQVQLIDHLGWTSQSPSVVTPPGSFQTGNILVDMLNKAAAGFTVGVDAAGINVAQGLTQNYGLLTSGSLIDKINQYLRGELGMLYVDNSGIFQFAQRNWWNPLGDPIATVGSLDRGNTTAVWLDPTLTEGTYSFPEALVRTWGPVTYTSWTQTFSGGGPATQGNSTVAVGVRQWTDTVENTVAGDVTANLSTLSAVLYNLPLFRGHFDASATVRFGVEYSAASMNYAAIAKPTDFIELSKEALVSLGYRQWVPGHVMSVQHTWDSMQGWWCTLNLDLGLAEADHEAGG